MFSLAYHDLNWQASLNAFPISGKFSNNTFPLVPALQEMFVDNGKSCGNVRWSRNDRDMIA